MAEAMDRMTAVTIAAIKGPCVGGGVVLAAACDLRDAADDTVFSIPEVDLGIPLAWCGIPRLVREIGPGVSASIGIAASPVDGATAAEVLLAADRACYYAKRNGRDRVATAAEGRELTEFSLQAPTPVDSPSPDSPSPEAVPGA